MADYIDNSFERNSKKQSFTKKDNFQSKEHDSSEVAYRSKTSFRDVHVNDANRSDGNVAILERTKVKKAKLMEMEINITSREEKVPLKRRLSTGDEPLNPVVLRALDFSPDGYLLGRVEASAHSSLKDDASEGRHHVRLTEVAPSCSSIIGAGAESKEWRMSLSTFTNKKQGPDYDKSYSKRIRSYYKAQDELITAYEEMHLEIDDAMDNAESQKLLMKKASLLAKITLLTNVGLLIAKLAAAIISGSISIISSLVDSVVDFASGIVIWMAARVMKRRNPYVYPQGRTKLEPIAIIILSVIMSLASLQLIREAVEKTVSLANLSGSIPNVDLATIIITVSAIVVKFILYLVCRRVKSPSIQALAMDHRNDVLSNAVAIVFGYIGSQDMRNKTNVTELVFLDPVGAILISIYIAINWWITGYDQIKLLTGHTAKPDFLKKLTWLSANHHHKIKYVDTVRAFHFGNNFLVEVDVVLPEEMRLRRAHDIGESLQQKLERLPEVERAFVHLDYEFEHKASDEHKMV